MKLKTNISFLYAWIGFLLIAFSLKNTSLLSIGNFSFYTAMSYHGLLIPAWMLLIIAYSGYCNCSSSVKKFLSKGSVISSILVGISTLLNNNQNFSIYTIILITGMIIAEITAIIIIIESIKNFSKNKNNYNKIAWWTSSIAIIAMSLATPLGHIAGTIKDLNSHFPVFIQKLSFIKQSRAEGFTDAHSHQILAAFLAASFSIPLIKKYKNKNISFPIKDIGLSIILITTITQVFIYQYCAWLNCDTPTLFQNKLNGMPLDDFVLTIMALGFLLLIPSLLNKNKNFSNTNLSFTLIAYLISIIFLGIFIEFHEQFFGYGEKNTPGMLNDLAYIRAHLLFDFMIIPLLTASILNSNFIQTKIYKKIYEYLNLSILTTGLIGVFIWTFYLNSFLIKLSLILIIIFMFFSSFISLKTQKS
jgi:hypothetical protein